MHTTLFILLVLACVIAGCATPGMRRDMPRYAIAIHAGAGVIDPNRSPEEIASYEAALRGALTIGRDELARGGSALDACEKVVRFLEDDPKFNAGRGAVYTEDEKHELDASVMDGRTLACGAVAGVRTVKNPVSLARAVMERTRHVMLMGDGAERFADEAGVERVPNTYFDTPHRLESLRRKLEERAKGTVSSSFRHDHTFDHSYKGTVGCVALDYQGNLAAATSTGGLTAKRWGRVGDSPVIGAGCFADNRTCAVSCTGEGEEFIRHGVARTIANLIEFRDMTPQRAAEEVVFRRLRPDDGGVIVVSRTGEIAMVYSTAGMFRGAADSSGRFEIGIWKEMRK